MASREDRWLHPLRGAWAGQFNTADGEEKKKKKTSPVWFWNGISFLFGEVVGRE